MRKYWAFVKAGFKNTIVYRADFFLWGFNEFFDTLVFLFIWILIYGEKNKIGGFSLPETITYLIGVGLIADLISTRLMEHLSKDIQSGWLSNLLIKPLNYPSARFSLTLAVKPLNLLIRTVVYLLVVLFFRDKIVVSSDIWSLILTLVSVSFALIINTLLDFLVGCLAFWTVTTEGFSGIMRTIKSIFSGGYAPIVFFPKWFQFTAVFLPFAYTRSLPMLIYLGKVSKIEAIKGVAVQVLWIVILYLLAKFVWRAGIKRYEGVGI